MPPRIKLSTGSLLGLAGALTAGVCAAVALTGLALLGWDPTGLSAAGRRACGVLVLTSSGAGLVALIALMELPIGVNLWVIRRLGYDGAEIVLTQRVLSALEAGRFPYRSDVHHFHEPWTIPSAFTRLAVRLRLMPETDRVPAWINRVLSGGARTVVHSDGLASLARDHAHSMMVEFVRTEADPLPPPGHHLVFDVFYSTDARSVDAWKASVRGFFDRLPPGEKATVHLYGFRLGITPKRYGPRGKGLFPDKGDFPIDWFLGECFEQIGEIVLELSPFDTLKDILSGRLPTRGRFQRFYDRAVGARTPPPSRCPSSGAEEP